MAHDLGPYRRSARNFGDSSTRNMIDHLRLAHGITKDNPEGNRSGNQSMGSSTSRIEEAFGNTPIRVIFNKDIFRLLLLRWIIMNNISFRQVEDESFCTLLVYLCACVSA